MNPLLVSLAVAYAALCVWLGVRIVNRRERWAKWTLAGVIAVPSLYVGSFGPACWLASYADEESPHLVTVYQPLLRVMAWERTQALRDQQEKGQAACYSSLWLRRGALAWYCRVGAKERFCWNYLVAHEHSPGKPGIIQSEHWVWCSTDR
jgi:hypothetical protein